MGLALKACHLGYLFDGEGTVLYQGLGLSKAFLGEEAEDGRTVHLLETVLEFVFIGAHLQGQFMESGKVLFQIVDDHIV